MINKASLLTDETAQAYGFTEEELADVVPDDVLAILSKAALVSGGELIQPNGDAVPRIGILTGSYTGTGVYGANNPNTLTAPGTILFFMVVGIGDNSATVCATAVKGADTVRSSYTYDFNFSLDWSSGNTVRWYSMNAGRQFNAVSPYYYAIAYSIASE